MDILGLERIRRLATRFRAAIQRCDRAVLSPRIRLETFPFGACGDASPLLAAYLEEMGEGIWTYVKGDRDGESHAWIEQDGLIVDITADQFPEVETAVIVTARNAWHETFFESVQPWHSAHFNVFDRREAKALEGAYLAILACLMPDEWPECRRAAVQAELSHVLSSVPGRDQGQDALDTR